jgi:hypothetical protein
MQEIKRMLALYVGGMGSKEENFHKRMIERYGYVDAAQTASRTCGCPGARPEAVAAVPEELADAVSLIGTRDRRAREAARLAGLARDHAAHGLRADLRRHGPAHGGARVRGTLSGVSRAAAAPRPRR